MKLRAAPPLLPATDETGRIVKPLPLPPSLEKGNPFGLVPLPPLLLLLALLLPLKLLLSLGFLLIVSTAFRAFLVAGSSLSFTLNSSLLPAAMALEDMRVARSPSLPPDKAADDKTLDSVAATAFAVAADEGRGFLTSTAGADAAGRPLLLMPGNGDRLPPLQDEEAETFKDGGSEPGSILIDAAVGTVSSLCGVVRCGLSRPEGPGSESLSESWSTIVIDIT